MTPHALETKAVVAIFVRVCVWCTVQARPVDARRAGAGGAEARRCEPASPRWSAAFVVVVAGSHVWFPAADLYPPWPLWTACFQNHALVKHYNWRKCDYSDRKPEG